MTPNILLDPDITLTSDMRQRIEKTHLRATLAVPLMVLEQVIGVLGVSDQAGRHFTPEDFQVLQTFADEAAMTLHNADLYAEALRKQREGEVFTELL